MGNGGEDDRFAFPLSNLQIGDLQAYLSHITLFLATESNKFYILVDNRPWLESIVSRPAHFWQYMVTKSRESPFVNKRSQRVRNPDKDNAETKDTLDSGSSSPGVSNTTEKWFSVLDKVLPEKKVVSFLPLPMRKLKYSLQLDHELHRTLFGLIVFEVSWKNVRGINYLNLLQTDSYLGMETKCMKRWEFDSITQAVSCMQFWFSGTQLEQHKLKEYLLSTVVTDEDFHDAETEFSSGGDEDDNAIRFCEVCAEAESPHGITGSICVFSTASENMTSDLHTPHPPDTPYQRRKVTWSDDKRPETDNTPAETVDSIEHFESHFEATDYKDILILFRFDDRDLPYKLRAIIVSDLRLLTLLEAGLPSWVIFLQSYPLVCHIYRPWMCPLARALYVIISTVTVLIGFYDLYKNVPLLRATASHLFGPFFDWIESWEMVSRIKYLGTMLFLHHCRKAVKLFMMLTRSIRTFFAVLSQPFLGPLLEIFDILLPFWNEVSDVLESLFSVVWVGISSLCDVIGDVLEIIVFPFWFIFSLVWSIATLVILPVYWATSKLLRAPIRLLLALGKFVTFVFTHVYRALLSLWACTSGILRVASATRTTVTVSEASLWRVLWHDLFSRVFRALRSILNGLVAFFIACNRHRLSIYNHIKEFKRKLYGQQQVRDQDCIVPYRRRTSHAPYLHTRSGWRRKFSTE